MWEIIKPSQRIAPICELSMREPLENVPSITSPIALIRGGAFELGQSVKVPTGDFRIIPAGEKTIPVFRSRAQISMSRSSACSISEIVLIVQFGRSAENHRLGADLFTPSRSANFVKEKPPWSFLWEMTFQNRLTNAERSMARVSSVTGSTRGSFSQADIVMFSTDVSGYPRPRMRADAGKMSVPVLGELICDTLIAAADLVFVAGTEQHDLIKA